MAKHNYKGDVLVWRDGKLELSAELAFYLFTQYGFPLELVEEQAKKLLPVGSKERLFHSLKAYDKANGTELLKKIFTNERA